MIVFDIETGPLPWGRLKDLVPPFDEVAAVPDLGPFDPSSVALGNLKDQAKIDAKVADARLKHEAAAKSVAMRRDMARNDHVGKFTSKAALSATTGFVKAVGLWFEASEHPILGCVDESISRDPGQVADEPLHTATYWENEAKLIEFFWGVVTSNPSHTLVGHNIHGFDLPFLVRRSWILGVDVPEPIWAPGQFGRYFNPRFIDTMSRWACGGRDFIKLDEIDRAFGGAGKPDDCTGADFARLFDNGGDDRLKALLYLRNDLAMTRRVAEWMQLL